MKVLFLVALCASCVCGKVTPDSFPKCKRSDPQDVVEKCVLDGIEAMRPNLKAGIPEVNIPPLDPFTIPTLKLNRTATNLKIKATIRHTKAFGGSNFRVDKLRLNLNNKYVGEVKLFIPKLVVVTDYDVRGSRVLNLDINGKGRMRVNLTGITVVAKGNAKPVSTDGVEYLQADRVITRVRIGNAQIAVEETERPLAAASAVAFFNASPGVVLDILNPLIEETSAAVTKTFINKVFSSIPLNEILTDD